MPNAQRYRRGDLEMNIIPGTSYTPDLFFLTHRKAKAESSIRPMLSYGSMSTFSLHHTSDFKEQSLANTTGRYPFLLHIFEFASQTS